MKWRTDFNTHHRSPSSQNLTFYHSPASFLDFFLAPLYTIILAVSSLAGGGQRPGKTIQCGPSFQETSSVVADRKA